MEYDIAALHNNSYEYCQNQPDFFSYTYTVKLATPIEFHKNNFFQ